MKEKPKKQTLKEWAKEQLEIIKKEWPTLTVFKSEEDVKAVSKRMRPNG